MINLNLDLPYKMRFTSPDGEPAKIRNRDLTEGILVSAVGNAFPQSMPKTDRKIWAKLQDQLFEATDSIEVDETTFEWIYRQVEKWEAPAQFASRVEILLGELEKLRPAK